MSVRHLIKDLSEQLWPLLETEKDRERWLTVALADLPELRREISLSGNPGEFTVHLVAELLTRQGEKGRQGLLNLLDDVADQRGEEWEAKLKSLRERVTAFSPPDRTGANSGLERSLAVPGQTRLTLCRRLGKNWRDLAVYFDIPAHERRRFEAGRECFEILEWLENRGRLSELTEALTFLGRDDLIPLLLELNDHPAPARRQTDWPQERSPYPGLHHFAEADAPLFFGRDAEINDLLTRLQPPGNRFLAVIGASGSGKSSLVAAGVIPHIRATAWGKHWVPLRFTPGELGNDPFAPLLGQLKPLLERSRLDTRETGERLRARGDLGDLAEDLLRHEAEPVEWLLFIDQFEELFTVVAADYQPRFIALLAAAAQSSRLRIIVTLRADFFPHCLRHESLKDLLNAGAYSLTAPAPKALWDMIVGPASVAGLQFEEELPWRMLDDTGREPGALALMAYALSLLWERRHDGQLTHAAYDRFGGVQGAIRQQAEQVYARLDEVSKEALGDVFKELVEVDPERGVTTRKRASLDRFQTAPASLKLIDAFARQDARLLICDEDAVEVAHEALLTHWPRLSGWIEQRFEDFRLLRRVRLEASEWRKHRGYLWPHERLQEVSRMLKTLQPHLSRVEWAFIRPESDRLLKRIRHPATSHWDRAKIGDRLAEIGDPRPGVDCKDGLPDIVWCPVPGGEITLEDNRGTYRVEPFSIAKYPVTWGQYRRFLEAKDGYGNRRWWTQWRELKKRPVEQQLPANYPAVYVTWYDSMAFSQWLSVNLGYEIRLPTEWEWQQAATGGNPDNVFPWGPEWNSRYANTRESKRHQTTAVGMYPLGISPVGALDMSGNVLEWCANPFEQPESSDLISNVQRVVRGGSCSHGASRARTANRFSNEADHQYFNCGFRVIRSSPR